MVCRCAVATRRSGGQLRAFRPSPLSAQYPRPNPSRPEVQLGSVDNGNGTWKATITIELQPGQRIENALRSLWLQIDEIEYFLPATLPPGREPMSHEAWEEFVTCHGWRLDHAFRRRSTLPSCWPERRKINLPLVGGGG